MSEPELFHLPISSMYGFQCVFAGEILCFFPILYHLTTIYKHKTGSKTSEHMDWNLKTYEDMLINATEGDVNCFL